MNCPQCAAAVAVGARFCAFCGTPLRICGPCKSAWKADAIFCGVCGGSLLSQQPRIEQAEPITEVGIRLDDVDDVVLEVDADELAEDVVGFVFLVDQPDRRFSLSIGELTVGAGDKNNIVIAEPAVSWNHALLLVRPDRVRLQDSASTNGTFINGMRITRPQEVSHGDMIKFGNVELKVWLRPQIRE